MANCYTAGKRSYKTMSGMTSGKGKRSYTVTGYDRAAGGLTKYSRQKSNLARLIAASKETGYLDTGLSNYALNTTGSVTLLNPVPQGAAVTQRVGKKIVMKGLQCRGVMVGDSTALLNDVAYMIVYDKRPTGALPAITDILVSVAASSMNNDANSGRFRILKRCDEVLLGNTTATGVVANALTESSAKSADWWLDLKSAPVVYKAAGTGAIADIEEGALYLVTVGNTAAGTADAILAVEFRLRFLDV